MPNKNIEKRREAWRRWYEKNKNNAEVVKKKKARDVARFSKLVREKCSIENCDEIGERHHNDYEKPKEIIWLCKKHHELIHSNNNLCRKCDKPQRALGLCFNHWRQERRKKLSLKKDS